MNEPKHNIHILPCYIASQTESQKQEDSDVRYDSTHTQDQNTIYLHVEDH